MVSCLILAFLVNSSFFFPALLAIFNFTFMAFTGYSHNNSLRLTFSLLVDSQMVCILFLTYTFIFPKNNIFTCDLHAFYIHQKNKISSMREEHKSHLLLHSAIPSSVRLKYMELIERKKSHPLEKENIANLHENCIVLFLEIKGIEKLSSETELLSILSDVFCLCETVSKRHVIMRECLRACVCVSMFTSLPYSLMLLACVGLKKAC